MQEGRWLMGPGAPDLMPGHALTAPSRAGATPGAQRVVMRCPHPGPEGWVAALLTLPSCPSDPLLRWSAHPCGVSSSEVPIQAF